MHATVLCYTVLRIFGALLLVIGPCSDVGALMAPWPVSKPPSAVLQRQWDFSHLPHYHTHLQNGVVVIGFGDWKQRFRWATDNLVLHLWLCFLKSARLFWCCKVEAEQKEAPRGLLLLSLFLSLGKWIKVSLSPPLSPPNSAPRLPNPKLSWRGGCASLSANLGRLNFRTAEKLLLKTRTMGRQERGWIICLSFLGFVVSVESITRAELFSFGPSAGDQILAAGNDQTHRLELDNPILFYDGTFDSIFVSYLVAEVVFTDCVGVDVLFHNVHRPCAIAHSPGNVNEGQQLTLKSFKKSLTSGSFLHFSPCICKCCFTDTVWWNVPTHS